MGLRCVLVDDNNASLEETRLLLEQKGVTVVGIASSTCLRSALIMAAICDHLSELFCAVCTT